jgi:hypothetical protein
LLKDPLSMYLNVTRLLTMLILMSCLFQENKSYGKAHLYSSSDIRYCTSKVTSCTGKIKSGKQNIVKRYIPNSATPIGANTMFLQIGKRYIPFPPFTNSFQHYQ